MAVDYGDARTGVAFSDLSNSLAGQAQTLTLTGKTLVAALAALYRENGCETIVVGLPKNMDGSLGARAQKSQALAKELEKRGLRVVLRDERLTTVSAHAILNETNVRGKARKQTVDSVAAALILQEYLDFLRERGAQTAT